MNTFSSDSTSQNGRPRLSVVIPAYNEAERIGDTLARILEYLGAQDYQAEVLVVDDGSADQTREVVALIAQDGGERVRLLGYEGNRGKGYAVRFGMLRARGDWVLFCDADLSTPIEEVEHLWAAFGTGVGTDGGKTNAVAIASRDVRGSQLVKRQSVLREAGGKCFNRCVQWMVLPGIHDTQCGFKLFSRQAAQDVFGRCVVDNFSFDVEALFVCRQLGYRVHEVPVRWEHREGSKVRFARDAVRMLRTVIGLRLAALRPVARREASPVVPGDAVADAVDA